jgi:hypothetical protein
VDIGAEQSPNAAVNGQRIVILEEVTMKISLQLVIIIALFSISLHVQGAPVMQMAKAESAANATVQPPCDEAAFDHAFAIIEESAGGTITFNCGSAASINFTDAKKINLPVTIDGGDQVTLSGGNSTQLFQVDSGGSLTLRRLTLTRGFSSGDGGAISNNGTLILENSTIHNSNAVGSGGAIVSYGPLTITGSTLSDNSAANAGAIYPRWSAATTMITNSSLRNNRTTSMVNGWGGAILLWDGANVTIEGGEIVGNSARLGGGIHNRFANSTVTLTKVQVIGNKATVGSVVVDINGGGIYNINGTVIINDTVFSGNEAGWSGGAIHNGGSATVKNSAFTGNSAVAFGGGMSNAGTATVRGSVFNNNSSDFGSGMDNSGTVTIQNATFSGNFVRERGVMHNRGNATIYNATFSDNIDDTGQATASTIVQISELPLKLKNVVLKLGSDGFTSGNCDVFSGQAPITSEGFNLSDDRSCTSYFTKAGDKNNTNPMLGPLLNNGGPTMTHLPEAGSPLIDGGQCIASITTDQRGVARPQGTACDIGAVEVQSGDHQKQVFLPLLRK